MRMLIVWLSVLLFLSGSVQVLASEKIVISGKLTQLRIAQEDTKSVQLEIEVFVTLENHSNTNVILYGSDFDFINLDLFKEDELKRCMSLYHIGGLKSTGDSNEVSQLRNQLDQERPPDSLTRLLKPGNSLTFTTKTSFVIFKRKSSYMQNESWDTLQTSSPLALVLTFEMFPGNLGQTASSTSAFGKVLQARWRKFGYLLIDEVVSKPIPIDLSIVKSDSPKAGEHL
jgi:hypothetical protein